MPKSKDVSHTIPDVGRREIRVSQTDAGELLATYYVTDNAGATHVAEFNLSAVLAAQGCPISTQDGAAFFAHTIAFGDDAAGFT